MKSQKEIKNEFVQVLKEFLPEKSWSSIANLLIENKVYLKICAPRLTKLGDYRHPQNAYGHRISINNDLNPFAFLITLVHELAHLKTWEKHQNKVKPHGFQWKSAFQKLMIPFLQKDIFPDEIKTTLINYMKNPAASSCTDLALMRVLNKYDKKTESDEKEILIENLALGKNFKTLNGRYFKKISKRRTRFLCEEITSKRQFTFHPLTKVIEV